MEPDRPQSDASADKQGGSYKIPRSWVRTVCAMAAGICVAATAGLCGRAWFLLELFAHWRVQYIWGLAVCAVALLVFRRWRTAGAVGLLAVLLGATLLPFYTGSSDRAVPRTLRVLQANILYESDGHDALLEMLRAADADVVVLLEVTSLWESKLKALSDVYPYSRVLPQSGAFGLAVLSRLPVEEWQELSPAESQLPAEARLPAILARIGVDGRPVNVLAAHVFPPISPAAAATRNAQMAALAAIARGQSAPVILLGDLNATPWSPQFKDLLRDGGLADARRGHGVNPTWPTFWPSILRIPIDHCLTTPNITVQDFRTGGATGSDHLPIIVDLVLPE